MRFERASYIGKHRAVVHGKITERPAIEIGNAPAWGIITVQLKNRSTRATHRR